MKTKLMLIAGSSDLVGAEIDGTDDSLYNRQHSFGNLLANKLDRVPVNIAMAGSTNQGISRSVLEWFDSQYDDITMDVFVLVGWTESLRMEIPASFDYPWETINTSIDWFPNESIKYNRVNLGYKGGKDERNALRYYQEFLANNDIYMEISSAKDVLMLEYFFKVHNIEYLMCNTLNMFSKNRHSDFYTDMIDQAYYYNMMDNDAAFYWKYKNLGYSNPKAKYWHHGEIPHQLYAEELYKFLSIRDKNE